ncbi:ECF transporter S component [Sporofaciens sp. SGI.106]|uniref:ECF transporter S component n=1 Tax=Sporofaciens sp. SGI.106 TaxID=3420568 RepID=UPI003D026643
MNSKTNKITIIGMLSAIAYVSVIICRVPVVLFLKYEPKDTIIALGGFIFGPMASFYISVIVSFTEMMTISDTGIIGCVMNTLASCAFACVSAAIYKRKRTLQGEIIGLAAGILTMVIVMLAWNYLLTPIYMGYPQEDVVKLLLPAILPFNLLKGGLNAAFTFLFYKPIVHALRKRGLIE